MYKRQIVVDADNAKVQIVFDNVDITCASSAAVYVKSAEKVFVTVSYTHLYHDQ